jgi:hypothetical protein
MPREGPQGQNQMNILKLAMLGAVAALPCHTATAQLTAQTGEALWAQLPDETVVCHMYHFPIHIEVVISPSRNEITVINPYDQNDARLPKSGTYPMKGIAEQQWDEWQQKNTVWRGEYTWNNNAIRTTLPPATSVMENRAYDCY